MFVSSPADGNMETVFQTIEHLWGGDWEEMVRGIYHRCLAVLGVDI